MKTPGLIQLIMRSFTSDAIRHTSSSGHERALYYLLLVPPNNVGGAEFSRPLGKTNFVYSQAAAATRGTVIVNGLWCSKARSRWPTIVYFGL